MVMRFVIALIIAAACLTGWTAAAQDPNCLEMAFVKNSEGYFNRFHTRKVGATTCTITTPKGTYACVEEAIGFVPGEDFLNDHVAMSSGEFSSVIATPWTLVWDTGLGPTETTVTINFGTILESDFPEAPTIVFPVDGQVYVNPDPNPFAIEWAYSGNPCAAQLDDFGVLLISAGGDTLSSDDLSESGCDVTSWTPSAYIYAGSWSVQVYNLLDIRDVPVGLNMTGDPWVLDNSGWLGIISLSQADITVPAKEITFGYLKALYR